MSSENAAVMLLAELVAALIAFTIFTSLEPVSVRPVLTTTSTVSSALRVLVRFVDIDAFPLPSTDPKLATVSEILCQVMVPLDFAAIHYHFLSTVKKRTYLP